MSILVPFLETNVLFTELACDVRLIENQDISFRQQLMTLPLFSCGPRACFGWFSCRGVIVWSVVCCVSLSLALRSVSARCLLTLCLTAIGSYMKPACRKNTFHINLPGPLVKTFAPMNHDLSEKASVFARRGSIRRSVRLFQIWQVI